MHDALFLLVPSFLMTVLKTTVSNTFSAVRGKLAGLVSRSDETSMFYLAQGVCSYTAILCTYE